MPVDFPIIFKMSSSRQCAEIRKRYWFSIKLYAFKKKKIICTTEKFINNQISQMMRRVFFFTSLSLVLCLSFLLLYSSKCHFINSVCGWFETKPNRQRDQGQKLLQNNNTIVILDEWMGRRDSASFKNPFACLHCSILMMMSPNNALIKRLHFYIKFQ